MFTAALFIRVKSLKYPNVRRLMNERTKDGAST